MTKSRALLAALVFPAFVLAGVAGNPAWAQEKKSVQKAKAGEVTEKEVAQNDKFRVYERTYQPGDVSPSANRSNRVVHALQGGTLERTYADGKKETVVWKTGETRINAEDRPFAVKNIGKSVVRLLIVELK